MTDDKLPLPPGPWDNEPNRIEWYHNGLPCLMNRNKLGVWCGYVAVPPGHPLHGKHYDHEDLHEIHAHGGLTFASECHGEICHVPREGEPDDVWWFGFDCGHYMDLVPRIESILLAQDPSWLKLQERMDRGLTYRDAEYVKGECERLASQLSDAASTREAAE